jgi:hypothetical protein
MTRKISVGLLLALSFAILPLSAHAAEYNLPWEKFNVQAGVFFANLNDKVTVGAEGAGVAIDVETALGLKTQNNSFRLGTFYRIGEYRRSRVDLTYFYFNRNATKVIGQDIVVDNVTINAGANVNSTFNFQILKAEYSYSFFQDDRMDLAASIGLFVMPIKFELTTPVLGGKSADLKFTAPLPVFGLRGDFAITPRWYLRSSLEFFYLNYGDFTGGLLDTNIAVDYNPWKHFGIGVGLENFRMGLKSQGNDVPGFNFQGDVKMQFIGVQLYAKYFF